MKNLIPWGVLAGILFAALITPMSAHSWPVKLPQTGQENCYKAVDYFEAVPCAGTGQDGDLAAGVEWPDTRFTTNQDGTVTDNLTGLMWVSAPDSIGRTWAGALTYINNLNFAGHTDWRLPNVSELESLLHAGEINTAAWLNLQGFQNVQANWYWSSTTVSDLDFSSYAYITDLWNGTTGGQSKETNNIYAWPVRDSAVIPAVSLPQTGQTKCYSEIGALISCAGTGQDGEYQKGVAWPAERFTDNKNGTVTDNLTGLIWLKNANCNGLQTWGSVLAVSDGQSGLSSGQCGLSDGSKAGDWRLPNRKELWSLADRSRSEPALPDKHPFTGIQQDNYYWSSTTDLNHNDTYPAQEAYVFSTPTGEIYYRNKNATAYMWPVRGPSVKTHTLTLTKSGKGSGAVASKPGGIECGGTCSGSFEEGSTVTLTAEAQDAWSVFSKWSGCNTFNGNVCTVTMTANKKVTATFNPTPTYQLTVTQGHANAGKGTITSDDMPMTISCGIDCREKYLKGTVITLTAIADSGSVFKGWKPSTSPCATTDPCAVTMDKAKSVQGVFVGDYLLKVVNKSQKVHNVSGSGAVTYVPASINCVTGSVSNCSGKVPYHTLVTLAAVPDVGSELSKWSGCPSPSGNNCTLTMDKAFTVTATFAPDKK